jgi:hypothetical protein
VTGSNKATLREASLSRISLTLTAQQAAAAKKGGVGRIERAARDAGRSSPVPARAALPADRAQPPDRACRGRSLGRPGVSP